MGNSDILLTFYRAHTHYCPVDFVFHTEQNGCHCMRHFFHEQPLFFQAGGASQQPIGAQYPHPPGYLVVPHQGRLLYLDVQLENHTFCKERIAFSWPCSEAGREPIRGSES